MNSIPRHTGPRGRVETWASAWGAVKDWFRQPYDYRWMADFQNSRPVGILVGVIVAMSAFSFGVLALLTIASPSAGRSAPTVVFMCAVACSTVMVGMTDTRGHIDALIHGVRNALRGPQDSIAVTVSIGAATVYRTSRLWDQKVVDVITRARRVADSLMYEAKAGGGDRAVTALL